MARLLDRQKAIELRKLGKTYVEIRKELGIAKSTLSDWLSKYPLSSEQLVILQKNRSKNKELGIEKIRMTKQRHREERLSMFYEDAIIEWEKLSQRELALAGLFLYWGEGTKSIRGSLAVANTDPQVVKFALYWMLHGLQVPKASIKVDLQLYSDMNISESIQFWSKELDLPLSHFTRPYIKQSTRVNIEHKGFGQGTCVVKVNNARLKEKVIMTIKAISEHYTSNFSFKHGIL